MTSGSTEPEPEESADQSADQGPALRLYTRKGDDGTTGLLYGGRVAKDSARPTAYGEVDEAQAALGVARAECEPGRDLDRWLVEVERHLWVLMAELATEPANRAKLVAGQSLVTPDMVTAVEARIDEVMARFEPPAEFVVPGQTRIAALLDVARTVVRRAERVSLAATTGVDGSQVVPYLNRLSDLCWALARWVEGDTTLAARSGESG